MSAAKTREIFFLFVIIMLTRGKADSATENFTISSARYGHVHYGIHENLGLLEFSKSLPPAYFFFTNNFALQEVESGKCVDTLSKTNRQLVLTSNCKVSWRYSQDTEKLISTNTDKSGDCISPWSYSKPPAEVQFVPGLSECAEWSRVVLRPMPKRTTTTKSTETFTSSVMYSTKGQSSNTNSNTMFINGLLYIFLPITIVLLAIIIVIITILVGIKKREENNTETENQHYNDQSITEFESDGYTELDQNREPENTYMSLVHYENPDDGPQGRSFVVDSNVNYVNEEVIWELQTTSHDYEIPAANSLATLGF